ncbi:TPA: DUF2787 family protein [Serratia fonticola]
MYTLSEWQYLLEQLFHRHYGITLNDTKFDDEEIIKQYWMACITPAQAVNAWANKYQLERIDNTNNSDLNLSDEQLIMKENIIHQEEYRLPVNQKLIDLLFKEMKAQSSMKQQVKAASFIFRDSSYNAETGGYHPVEIRLVRKEERWFFDYITDFAYMGRVYPELEKEIDFSWSQQYAFHAGLGDLGHKAGCELFELWQSNFIQYYDMDVYTIQFLWEI